MITSRFDQCRTSIRFCRTTILWFKTFLSIWLMESLDFFKLIFETPQENESKKFSNRNSRFSWEQSHRSCFSFSFSSRKILATKFQPTDARKAFPCFDEPHLKAVFRVTIVHPPDTTALANFPCVKKYDRKVLENCFVLFLRSRNRKKTLWLVRFLLRVSQWAHISPLGQYFRKSTAS